MAVRCQRVTHGIGRACGGIGHIPAAELEAVQHFIEHGTRCDLCSLKSLRAELPLREIA